MNDDESLDHYITAHIRQAFALHDYIRGWYERHPGEGNLVLIEGSLQGLEQALAERLSYYMSVHIHQAEHRGEVSPRS